MTAAPASFLPFAHELADTARTITARYWRQPVAVDHKADDSPVTIADREIERALRDRIGATHPDHGIEGEEYGAARQDAEFVWHLDPIDGTKSFITGRPLFGTLIALAHRGRPILGIIDHGVLDERWVGVRGQPTTWNGREVGVRACPSLELAVSSLTHPQMFTTPYEKVAWARLEVAVRLPMYGGDCYGYGLLAMGYVDLILEASLDTHDFMALVPVVEGAGGIMTDWTGAPLTAASGGQVLAAGDPRVHREALALIGREAS
jgi:inositol-phosphate phosphatase/L-galactose 1-phosphate phosphatase/histidinol-phosphatase